MAEQPQARPQASQPMLMLLMFMMVMFILFIPEARAGLGYAAGIVLEPLIGFGGRLPVVTIILAGMIPLVISIVLRHFMVDWVAAGRMTEVNKAIGKQMRQALSQRNQAKMKKLQELRMEVMKEFGPVMNAQMRPTVITMLLFITVFAWLSNFVYNTPAPTTFAVPWDPNAFLGQATVLPHWILLYSALTLPLSLALPRVLKYFSFTRKLQEMGQG